MLTKLQVSNFYLEDAPNIESAEVFRLQTCQRTLYISNKETHDLSNHSDNVETGKDGYDLLLRIICGLKSKLIAENEIVSQFKDAYRDYAESNYKDTKVLLFLEKLFRDAKEIRSNYLIGLSQKTYSALTRKEILKDKEVNSVVIMGSGALAEDMINQLKKKTDVFVCARNTQKVNELCKQHDVKSITWDQNFRNLESSPYIINTIGSADISLNHAFFKSWDKNNLNKKFIDLGSPSIINTHFTIEDNVFRLSEIFKAGVIHEDYKLNQISKAQSAINELVNKRATHFEKKAQL